MSNHSVIVSLVLVFSAGLAFELGISSAITEILAGVILALFFDDIARMDWLRFLANLGMLGLMFMGLYGIVIFPVEVLCLFRLLWKLQSSMD